MWANILLKLGAIDGVMPSLTIFEAAMTARHFIPFLSPLAQVEIPSEMNDPFGTYIPEIAQLASAELQFFIGNNQQYWLHNFGTDSEHQVAAKGKMFGVLVVRAENGDLGYLATFSGKILDEPHPSHFVPSLFDVTTNDSFITKGMLELNAISETMKSATSIDEYDQLKAQRKNRSYELQHQLFASYVFLNAKGESKSLVKIFSDYEGKIPPAGAGECSAPKLLHYAYEHQLTPIAIAEFWWGKSNKSETRKHLHFYPACVDKCVPILGFMV